MSIKVGRFVISREQYGLSLTETRVISGKHPKTKAERVGQEYQSTPTYYSNLASVGKKIIDMNIDEGIEDSKSFKALIEIVKKTKAEIDLAYRDLKWE